MRHNKMQDFKCGHLVFLQSGSKGATNLQLADEIFWRGDVSLDNILQPCEGK